MRPKQTIALESYLNQLLDPTYAPSKATDVLPAQTTSKIIPGNIERLLSELPTETTLPPPVQASVAPKDGPTIAPKIDPSNRSVPTLFEPQSTPQKLTEITPIEIFKEGLPEEFQTLIFYVGKLQLALPLHLLGGIVKKTEEPTPLFGCPAWFSGLLTTSTGSLQVVDTAMYLFNERYDPAIRDEYQYIIRIGDSVWGLYVTELCTTKVLSKNQIQWFPSTNGRPWIAGIVKEEKCALINAPALTGRFQNESQKKRSKPQKGSMLDGKAGTSHPPAGSRTKK